MRVYYPWTHTQCLLPTPTPIPIPTQHTPHYKKIQLPPHCHRSTGPSVTYSDVPLQRTPPRRHAQTNSNSTPTLRSNAPQRTSRPNAPSDDPLPGRAYTIIKYHYSELYERVPATNR
ncbi:hypothetical protein C8R44DRAFT_772763 [Mycena epipterygia]|nr:hypothetical protein C8R44DRAFT_772763 [Mycena epipterygia]